MPEPAFDTLEAARRLKSAGIDSEHAEAIVEVMGQSVNQLLTREHFSAELRLTRDHFDAGIVKLGTELHARIDAVHTELDARIDAVHTKLDARISGVETRLQSLETTVRAEMMRAVLIVVGILIPATGLMLAIVEFYSSRGGGT